MKKIPSDVILSAAKKLGNCFCTIGDTEILGAAKNDMFGPVFLWQTVQKL
jgi:hypothetical protein